MLYVAWSLLAHPFSSFARVSTDVRWLPVHAVLMRVICHVVSSVPQVRHAEYGTQSHLVSACVALREQCSRSTCTPTVPLSFAASTCRPDSRVFLGPLGQGTCRHYRSSG